MQPEQVLIAVSRPDKSVAIVVFVTRSFLANGETEWQRDPSPENVESLIARAGLTAASWRFLAPGELPENDRYFDAWVDRGTRIDVDMPRARGIARERLRALRAPLLETLDAEYMRADERGDAAAKAQIAARKQALRDAPADPRIERAATPAELDATTIAILSANRTI